MKNAWKKGIKHYIQKHQGFAGSDFLTTMHTGTWAHCKYLNARSECNDIVISVFSHYPLDPNAKSSDTKCVSNVTNVTNVSDDFAFGSRW